MRTSVLWHFMSVQDATLSQIRDDQTFHMSPPHLLRALGTLKQAKVQILAVGRSGPHDLIFSEAARLALSKAEQLQCEVRQSKFTPDNDPLLHGPTISFPYLRRLLAVPTALSDTTSRLLDLSLAPLLEELCIFHYTDLLEEPLRIQSPLSPLIRYFSLNASIPSEDVFGLLQSCSALDTLRLTLS